MNENRQKKSLLYASINSIRKAKTLRDASSMSKKAFCVICWRTSRFSAKFYLIGLFYVKYIEWSLMKHSQLTRIFYFSFSFQEISKFLLLWKTVFRTKKYYLKSFSYARLVYVITCCNNNLSTRCLWIRLRIQQASPKICIHFWKMAIVS